MRCFGWTIVAVLAGTGLACDDDKNDLPPSVLNAQRTPQRETTKPAPTTQDLLTGAKKTLRLGDYPLTLEAPANWALQSTEGGSVTVGGPASSGEITILLNSQRQTIPASRLNDIVAQTKKETDAKPHPINRVELRSLGAAKVLEQRMISNAFEGGRLAPEVMEDEVVVSADKKEKKTVRAIKNPHIVKWIFTVFVPNGNGDYTTRTLTFNLLKLSEYDQDKQFLEQLMQSLRYEE